MKNIPASSFGPKRDQNAECFLRERKIPFLFRHIPHLAAYQTGQREGILSSTLEDPESKHATARDHCPIVCNPFMMSPQICAPTGPNLALFMWTRSGARAIRATLSRGSRTPNSFRSICPELGDMMRSELDIGRSARMVDKFYRPGGKLAKNLETYQAAIKKAKAADLTTKGPNIFMMEIR